MDQDMDQVDRDWLDSFIGKSIPQDAVVEGFYSIITWIDPDGERCWRTYNQFDLPVSTLIGVIELAKHQLIKDCVRFPGGEDDDA